MNNFEKFGRIYVLCGGTKEDFCLEGSRLSKLVNKLSKDIDEGEFLTWLVGHAECCRINQDGDLEIGYDEREVTERVRRYHLSTKGMVSRICTEKIIDFVDDEIEVGIEAFEHKCFQDIYEQLFEGFSDILKELKKALMKAGYTDETELHNDKGTADCECKGAAKKARATCKRNRGCRTCRKGWQD